MNNKYNMKETVNIAYGRQASCTLLHDHDLNLYLILWLNISSDSTSGKQQSL